MCLSSSPGELPRPGGRGSQGGSIRNAKRYEHPLAGAADPAAARAQSHRTSDALGHTETTAHPLHAPATAARRAPPRASGTPDQASASAQRRRREGYEWDKGSSDRSGIAWPGISGGANRRAAGEGFSRPPWRQAPARSAEGAKASGMKARRVKTRSGCMHSTTARPGCAGRRPSKSKVSDSYPQ